MTHVLVLKVGPVQGFIAQARRTRDLWYGSRLLSRLSAAMARSLQESRVQLIFPHPGQVGDASTGVANKVLALVEGEPREVARRALQSAREVLLQDGEAVFQCVRDIVIDDAWELMREQLGTFLELHAAWARQETGADYASALAEAEAALEARRALHEFAPWAREAPAGTHKSSLDGGRPSVLRRERRRGGAWRQYRIGVREELDALGLLKRAGGRPDQFVPVPSVGLAAWVDAARRRNAAALDRLRQECAERGFTRVHRPGLPWVEAFPYDAQLLLPERWQPYFEEFAEDGTPPQEVARSAARFGAGLVGPVREAVGVEPYPYVACLVADGDGMGALLQALATRGGHEAHQRLSRVLAGFTREARSIVEAHRGVLVYAGGDDVLAFVCPADAPECALALSQAFQRVVSAALEGLGVTPPTLSVGLGIGHVLESLGELLDLGRRAERAAKDAGRNALAILVAKHAGRERVWTASWDSRPLERLGADMRLLRSGELPLGKVHEVEDLARSLSWEAIGEDAARRARVLTLELTRILARVEAGRLPRPLSLEAVGLAGLGEPERGAVHPRLEEWASRVLVADTLERAGRGLSPEEDGR